MKKTEKEKFLDGLTIVIEALGGKVSMRDLPQRSWLESYAFAVDAAMAAPRNEEHLKKLSKLREAACMILDGTGPFRAPEEPEEE